MTKLFCGIVALVLLAGVAAKAAEVPTLEVRKWSAIGQLGLVNVQVAVQEQADGSLLASFQAPDAGTYVLVYTSGPYEDKTATRVNVWYPGPVSAKFRR